MIKRDLIKTREKVAEKFDRDFQEANKLWYDSIRLTITLSSSFLLLTLALVEKLFPKVTSFNDLSIFLITAWIALFLSIIFGISAQLDSSIFHGNLGRDAARTMKEIDEKLTQGMQQDVIRVI